MKRLMLTLVRMGVVAAILYSLVRSDRLNFERLWLFREAPGVMAMMIGTIGLIMVPMAALRWWLLLRAIGLHLELRRTFVLTWIGNFFNTALPGAVTGDVVKGYYVIKAQPEEGRTRAFMTLVIDRLVGLLGLIVMAFLALLFNLDVIWSQRTLHALAWMIIAMFAGTVLFYGLILFPFKEGRDPFVRLLSRLPANNFMLKVYHSFKGYQHQQSILLVTLLLSIGIHCLLALLFFQMAQLMEMKDMSLATQFFIMPIGLITLAIPITPGGIGIGHVAFESLYQMAGLSGGADIFNLVIIVQLGVFLLGGIPYFLYNNEYKVLPQQEQAPF
jgi:uncharacterized protein (TIRG00374 family)